MNHIFLHSLISLTAAAVFLFFAPFCRADVLFVHDYKLTQYVAENQDAELLVGYTGKAMFIDKKIRYTGEMMRTFFGKVTEGRETTHFLLDKDMIREIDYYKGRVLVFPLARLSDIRWIKGKEKIDEATAKMIRDRYRTAEPKLSLTILPGQETIRGYACKRIEVDLRLETLDLRKNSSSVTLIKQKLWVSTNVPGYSEYNAFHRSLSKRLGLDAARLGSLSGVLSFWDGSLDPIRKSIKEVKGYPVKSITTVEGRYTAGVDTASPKISSRQIKEESVELRKVLTDKLDENRFTVPSDFGVTVVE